MTKKDHCLLIFRHNQIANSLSWNFLINTYFLIPVTFQATVLDFK